MNYDHLNKIHDYWRNSVFPHFVHRYSVASFDDYLRKFSFLPSGKWIRDLEKVKLTRVPFAIIPEELVKKYEAKGVSYNAPIKPEDGVQRVIYQYSTTLHFEAAFWMWIENEMVQSYAMVFVCYNDEKEYLNFVDELYKIRREGDTENKPVPPGFKNMQLADLQELARLK